MLPRRSVGRRLPAKMKRGALERAPSLMLEGLVWRRAGRQAGRQAGGARALTWNTRPSGENVEDDRS